MRKGLLILISGPSGTGKGTVCDLLRKNHPEISYSISASAKKSVVFASDLFNLFSMCNLYTIIKNRYFSPEPMVI